MPKAKVGFRLGYLHAALLGITLIVLAIFMLHPVEGAGTGAFEVNGPTITDPNGAKFIVKGVTPIYGPFAGGDSTGTWSTYSITNSAAIFSGLRTQWAGINTVRIFTSGGAVAGHAGADWNQVDYRNKLWAVVANARAQGFVVIVANSYSNVADTNSWITEVAAKYKGDPYVWITPSNEPFCTSPDASEAAHCYDWAYWHTQTQAQVALIRAQGNHNPILLNALDWSWDWRGYSTTAGIIDPDHRIIFGAHRYACSDVCKGWTSAEVADANVKWANLATTMPIVVDEIGNYNNGASNTGWYQGAVDFIANWVNTRKGAGAIAFNHYWSDGNSQTTNGSARNAWGNWWNDHYLGVVAGSVPVPSPTSTATPTAVPTASPSPTPTPSPTPSPTPIPTASPTPSPSPTPRPTASPTASPTAPATVIPTVIPTITPTPVPTPRPCRQWAFHYWHYWCIRR